MLHLKHPLPITEQLVEGLGKAVAGRVQMITADVAGLVKQTAQGVKVKPDVFKLGIAMADIWNYVRNLNWSQKTLLANAQTAAEDIADVTQKSVAPADPQSDNGQPN
ncbi:MAG: hypothetical protein HC915_12760 [Anaerolineae bacterium]|nr:hypothetical protein [Anaerolineae bacterium]